MLLKKGKYLYLDITLFCVYGPSIGGDEGYNLFDGRYHGFNKIDGYPYMEKAYFFKGKKQNPLYLNDNYIETLFLDEEDE